jgi:hypothetical protein
LLVTQRVVGRLLAAGQDDQTRDEYMKNGSQGQCPSRNSLSVYVNLQRACARRSANQICGIAREYDVWILGGRRPSIRQVPEALEPADKELTDIARALLAERPMDLHSLCERGLSVTRRSVRVSSVSPVLRHKRWP